MTFTPAQRGRINRKAGAQAEDVARILLNQLGLLNIERRETGWKVLRGNPDPRTGKRSIVGAVPMAKVSGDFTATAPGGRYVHVECKRHADPAEKLSLSDFEAHQIDALNRYSMTGCLALVVWVHASSAIVLRWPITGLAHLKPITFTTAYPSRVTSLSRTPHVKS